MVFRWNFDWHEVVLEADDFDDPDEAAAWVRTIVFLKTGMQEKILSVPALDENAFAFWAMHSLFRTSRKEKRGVEIAGCTDAEFCNVRTPVNCHAAFYQYDKKLICRRNSSRYYVFERNMVLI